MQVMLLLTLAVVFGCYVALFVEFPPNSLAERVTVFGLYVGVARIAYLLSNGFAKRVRMYATWYRLSEKITWITFAREGEVENSKELGNS